MKSAPAKPLDVRVRRAGPDDLPTIVQAYNALTGRRRTVEAFHWQYFANPAGSESWVLETPNGEFMGHHGILFLEGTHKGGRIVFGKTENTFIVPQYRSRIFYPRYERQIHESADGRYDLLYTTAPDVTGGAVGLLRKRAGYAEIGGMKVCVFHFRGRFLRSRLKKRYAARPIFAAAAGIATPLASGVWRLREKTAAARSSMRMRPLEWSDAALGDVEKFWRTHREHYALSPDRSARFYAWRYRDNPSARCRLFVFENAAGIAGYAVLRETGQRLKGVWLDDIIVARADARLVRDALACAADHLAAFDFAAVQFLGDDACLAEGARLYAGLANRMLISDPTPLLVKFVNIAPQTQIYFTALMSEGIQDD